MMPSRWVTATIVGVMLSTTALACGDSLYRAGKGVGYRTYSAPLPGNLLVFGNSDAARQLALELSRSGHNVQVVSNSDELGNELQSGTYDVVIAPYSERQSVEAASTSASYLPIATSGDEEQMAKQTYDTVMVPDKHEIKHYLKAIHSSLKENS